MGKSFRARVKNAQGTRVRYPKSLLFFIPKKVSPKNISAQGSRIFGIVLPFFPFQTIPSDQSVVGAKPHEPVGVFCGYMDSVFAVISPRFFRESDELVLGKNKKRCANTKPANNELAIKRNLKELMLCKFSHQTGLVVWINLAKGKEEGKGF